MPHTHTAGTQVTVMGTTHFDPASDLSILDVLYTKPAAVHCLPLLTESPAQQQLSIGARDAVTMVSIPQSEKTNHEPPLQETSKPVPSSTSSKRTDELGFLGVLVSLAGMG